jgi:septum site-determining protein MinC
MEDPMPANIEIKGIRDGLLITVDSGEWPEGRTALLAHLQEQRQFFHGAKVTLDVGNHILDADALEALRDQISEEGLLLVGVLSDSPTTNQATRSLGLEVEVSQPHPSRSAQPFDTSVEGDAAILVQRTLRSGNSIMYPGHVVVIGDVNPGAEIIAGGNIVVWGRVRGTLHAGAQGDETAIVCALELTPTQLRIAGKISITPTQDETLVPEIVRLKDGQVVAEPWNIDKKSVLSL